MANSLNDIARARLTLRTDHRGTLIDAAQGFAQVFCPANERHPEGSFIDMIHIIGRRKHLALIDIVNLYGLQNLRFGKMSDTAFGHDRDGDRLLNTANHLRVAHARHASRSPYVGGDSFQSHYRTGTCRLGNACLLRGSHIHNHAALQHLCQLAVQLLSLLIHFLLCL